MILLAITIVIFMSISTTVLVVRVVAISTSRVLSLSAHTVGSCISMCRRNKTSMCATCIWSIDLGHVQSYQVCEGWRKGLPWEIYNNEWPLQLRGTTVEDFSAYEIVLVSCPWEQDLRIVCWVLELPWQILWLCFRTFLMKSLIVLYDHLSIDRYTAVLPAGYFASLNSKCFVLDQWNEPIH